MTKAKTILCPSCGEEIPTTIEKGREVAYHDCGPLGRRKVYDMPKTKQAKPQESLDEEEY